jgi:hypothetical protein
MDIHPRTAGYQVIADLVVRAVEQSAGGSQPG